MIGSWVEGRFPVTSFAVKGVSPLGYIDSGETFPCALAAWIGDA